MTRIRLEDLTEQALSRLREEGQIMLTLRGEDVGVVFPPESLQLLEDLLDAHSAQRILDNTRDDEFVTLKELKREFGY